jgi:FkbM family methyltransferase
MESTYFKLRYYIAFTYYKLRILTDCAEGKRRLYLAELLHVWNVLRHTNREMPGYNHIQTISTIFGTYKFIGDNYGYSIMSPAFERPDKELFIRLIQKSLRRGKRVLYLDVGAYAGDYTVGVLKFIRNKKLTTFAFEPDPVHFSLLKENLRLNHIKKVRAYNLGLGNKIKTVQMKGYKKIKDTVEVATVPYAMKTLDSLLPASYYKKFDEIFVKIDIEGHEAEAFDGARYLLKSHKKICVMIEDCVNPSIIAYLSNHAFRQTAKITPYDSFWESP